MLDLLFSRQQKTQTYTNAIPAFFGFGKRFHKLERKKKKGGGEHKLKGVILNLGRSSIPVNHSECKTVGVFDKSDAIPHHEP